MEKQKERNTRIPFYTWPSKKVVDFFHSRPEGLSQEEAKARFDRYGENFIADKKKVHPWIIFFRQFRSVLIYVLLFAAAISFVVNHFLDVWIILGIVVFNAFLGFFLEYRAERSIEALKDMMAQNAKTLRNNKLSQIDSRLLVPGDIVFLEEGDRIPADGRILFADDVRVVESSLTGEAFPQSKSVKNLTADLPLGDQKNMLWSGTYMVSGEARMIVTATGFFTQLGEIAQKMEKIETTPTHFKERISILSKQLGFVAVLGTILTFLAGYYLAELEFSETFLAAVAILVSGIPEGLPAVLTIVLSVSASRMAKKKAIVRSLPAVETLAIVDTILTDKTGTLTDNTMNIVKAYLPGQEDISIEGKGWESCARFLQSGIPVAPLEDLAFRQLAHIAGRCSSAKVYPVEFSSGNPGDCSLENFEIVGDPTEAALVVFSRRAGISPDILDATEFKVDDLPFRSDRQFRSTLVHKKNDEAQILYVVGAPEKVLSRCDFIFQDGRVQKLLAGHQEEILSQVENWSKKTLRVIALAYRERMENKKSIYEDDVEMLVFAGLVGMMDTPREGVSEAVFQAKSAGIRVIMTTGDHKETAMAIAQKVGIATKNERAYTQGELEMLSEEEFLQVVRKVNVFARLTPDMKYRITQTLQADKKVVAVTGDGVNDALALRKADIGISMGKNGSDVAREAGAIILADDNFSTIVSAIEEGRIVFNNIRRSSSFLLTTSFAEYGTIIAALSLGTHLPFLPTQILWLNLVTDGFSVIPLAMEPSHGNAMKHPPFAKKERILSRQTLPFLLFITTVMIILSLGTFLWFFDKKGLDSARAAGFAVLAMTQIFNAFNMRSFYSSSISLGFFKNRLLIWATLASFSLLVLSLYFPPMQKIFGFSSLNISEFIVLFFLSSLILVAGDMYKRILYTKR
ncbi:MAG: HAD-IC family P-type ATPase [Candidatus Moraniibacteriota bacterium]|nr:MAG: HAD-IC family P-type ATPase [Candidatus Moranbacteria bacterium]